jgi:ferric-dicitrate binding protein FerR (iron transport regulator)
MNREDLIKKWLDNNLNTDELEAFKKFEDYESLVKLSDSVKHFKAPDYNTSEALQDVLYAIKTPKKSVRWVPILSRIAAIFVVCFGVYYYTTTLDTTFKTLASQKQTIELPDASTVALNATTTVSFNKKQWNTNRQVQLNGEAYFKVAKGSKFEVVTDAGTVTVLGTQFNIKQRHNYFEVVCYEGLVSVTYNNNEIKLQPGNRLLLIDGKLIATEKENQIVPSWINNNSVFKSLPYREVIAEFERQYDMTINLQSINDSQLFTGSFTHNNIDVALKSITLPLHLSYTKTDDTITLKRE